MKLNNVHQARASLVARSGWFHIYRAMRQHRRAAHHHQRISISTANEAYLSAVRSTILGSVCSYLSIANFNINNRILSESSNVQYLIRQDILKTTNFSYWKNVISSINNWSSIL